MARDHAVGEAAIDKGHDIDDRVNDELGRGGRELGGDGCGVRGIRDRRPPGDAKRQGARVIRRHRRARRLRDDDVECRVDLAREGLGAVNVDGLLGDCDIAGGLEHGSSDDRAVEGGIACVGGARRTREDSDRDHDPHERQR